MNKIGVIGAGAWGTALANAYATAGRDCTIWAREPEVVSAINEQNENTTFLKDIKLSPALKATANLEDITKRDILLLVTPAQYLRHTLEDIKPLISADTILVICAKGIEISSEKLLSAVTKEIIPEANLAILTGPTFASEIASGLPCAYTIAAENEQIGQKLQDTLATDTCRPYLSNDIIGAQIGGAIKNVIAIACGIIHGRKLGESARCALMTRGIAEMARLGEALGGKKETLLGMCGLGDLVLTASSMQSRNFSLGAALGEGQSLEDILGNRNAVTEGVHTARAMDDLARTLKIEMPICTAVNDTLTGKTTLDEAIKALLSRPLTQEI